MEKLDTGPFQIKISFKGIKKRFEELLKSRISAEKKQAEEALALLEACPELVSGTSSIEKFEMYTNEIEQIMTYLFPPALSNNEIKAAVYPYSNEQFYISNRFKKISSETSLDVSEVLQEMYLDSEESLHLILYAIILNKYYGFSVDFDRPKQIYLDDRKGNTKSYKVTFNADFIDIYPNENAVQITQEILDELLANAGDKKVWERFFPENSWTMEGFGIINMTDATLEGQIDEFKTHLIQSGKENMEYIVHDLRSIFGIDDLEVGSYRIEGDKLLPPFEGTLGTLTLEEGDKVTCSTYACNYVFKQLFESYQPVILSNIAQYHKNSGGNKLSETLLKKGLKSAVLLPVVIEEKLEFIIELAAYKANQLNAINMVKLDTIMPFILSYSKRSITEYENEISAVIQNECTSIHPSVKWRFTEEAMHYIQRKSLGESPVFNEVIFENVLPLYGQIDIVGSSAARNEAIKKDLTMELQQTKKILEDLQKRNAMPFYEQLLFKMNKKLSRLETDFDNNTEQEVHAFFQKQVLPLFQYIAASDVGNTAVKTFVEKLDKNNNSFYVARKDYDETVNLINKNLANVIDKQQIKAQEIFPHYFEKFKTDGIEHNMYVGQSIAEHKEYHESALFSLRLWQLQVMCEMEALYYQKQQKLSVKLDVASLILAYDVPLTIRYRIDEKQFDVDGAYNVRYEMIKKRIDKAHIKDTDERLTQPHKLCVVYSTSAIEKEYLNYFEFLQSKKYIGETIEIVELEELQGASGIKAIRVDINQELQKSEAVFSISDLQTTH